MSTDPSGLGKVETCVYAIKKEYIRTSFEKSDWCTYPYDDCLIYDTLTYPPEELCLLCQYRKPLDIPEILRKIKKENEK